MNSREKKRIYKCFRDDKKLYKDENAGKNASQEHMERVVFASLVKPYYCQTHKGFHIGHPKRPYPFVGQFGLRKFKRLIERKGLDVQLSRIG